METSKSRKRPCYKSGFDNDWSQAKDFWRTTKRNLKNVIPKVMVEASLAKLEQDRNKHDFTSELILMRESTIIVGTDGFPLVYFLKGALSWPFVNENPAECGLKALNILKEQYPPPPPKATDVRHLDRLHGIDQGVYQFALWHATGHSHAEGNQQELAKGAVISKDTIDTGRKLNFAMEFLHRFTPVTQAVGALFEVIDEDGYRTCKEKFDELAKCTSVSMLKLSSRSCFLGMAIIAGLSCLPHRDEKDVKTTWVPDMAFGAFDGGFVEIPQTGFKFEVKEGDILFMRSALLQHSVSPVRNGYRFGVVYYSHESIVESTK